MGIGGEHDILATNWKYRTVIQGFKPDTPGIVMIIFVRTRSSSLITSPPAPCIILTFID